MQPLLQEKRNYCYLFRECGFVALGTQREMHMRRYNHLWPLRLYKIFPHYLINGTSFEKKKNITEHNICVWIFLQLCVKHFSF